MLLVSGLMGLSRLEWMPAMYRNYSHLCESETRVRQASNGRTIVNEVGEVWPKADIDKVVQALKADISVRNRCKGELEHRHMYKQMAHKWLFISGIVLLIFSRAIWLSSSANDLPSTHSQSGQNLSSH